MICFFAGCQASKYERALLKKLFHSNYDKNERPVVNDSDAVVVVFGLTLNQIVDVVRYSKQTLHSRFRLRSSSFLYTKKLLELYGCIFYSFLSILDLFPQLYCTLLVYFGCGSRQ